jgi:arylsulfatase A-like enzyme
VAPGPQVQLDGVNLLPVLTGETAVLARKLFWRYKSQNQEAVREGKWKYLKINGHEFLFDIEADPLERGNLKSVESATFERLKREYTAWNQTMLKYRKEDRSYSLTGDGRIAERSF